jgi:hypothetical protein
MYIANLASKLWFTIISVCYLVLEGWPDSAEDFIFFSILLSPALVLKYFNVKTDTASEREISSSGDNKSGVKERLSECLATFNLLNAPISQPYETSYLDKTDAQIEKIFKQAITVKKDNYALAVELVKSALHLAEQRKVRLPLEKWLRLPKYLHRAGLKNEAYDELSSLANYLPHDPLISVGSTEWYAEQREILEARLSLLKRDGKDQAEQRIWDGLLLIYYELMQNEGYLRKSLEDLCLAEIEQKSTLPLDNRARLRSCEYLSTRLRRSDFDLVGAGDAYSSALTLVSNWVDTHNRGAFNDLEQSIKEILKRSQ